MGGRQVHNPTEYLLDGDPVIRWQTMRDLLKKPESTWKPERSRISQEGWGKQFLDFQLPDGGWRRERWTDTVWTMVQLCEMGLIAADDRCERAFEVIVHRVCPVGVQVDSDHLFKNMDLCHVGFWLRIGSAFKPYDPRLKSFAEMLLHFQMADGGWNCRIRTKPKTTHSSFHTTLNVLEGLRDACDAGVLSQNRFLEVENRAAEFMLQHSLYRSDKTGAVIDYRFLDLTFPSYWHYNVLRGLDYLARTKWILDSRLSDPLDWLESRRNENGRWIVEKRIPGVVHFDMEQMGKDSRWNTLRALRVLESAKRIELNVALG